ncbi:hypothetical protein KIN20_034072 [Parelaphostrongylus tenuis]|uniref:Uncharacterized protein n=1 Tax=Parelaphostrongylus tenuis TaxID=148309 RepID=A0AAD5R9A4_PARTN|nr:hypothetical protein KIN20_034072 [Parelaphostrongylus tenuis]
MHEMLNEKSAQKTLMIFIQLRILQGVSLMSVKAVDFIEASTVALTNNKTFKSIDLLSFHEAIHCLSSMFRMKMALLLVAFVYAALARPKFNMKHGCPPLRIYNTSDKGTYYITDDNCTSTDDYYDYEYDIATTDDYGDNDDEYTTEEYEYSDEADSSEEEWNAGKTRMVDLTDKSSERLTSPFPYG